MTNKIKYSLPSLPSFLVSFYPTIHLCSLSVMTSFVICASFCTCKLVLCVPESLIDRQTDRERMRGGERERVADSCETAADSNQSHEGALRPTCLIHKTRRKPLSIQLRSVIQ